MNLRQLDQQVHVSFTLIIHLGILHAEDMADGNSTVELTVYPYYMAEEIQVCTGQQQG